jgi:predicted O-methyltransferase YrrM
MLFLGSQYRRARLAFGYYWPKLRLIVRWLSTSREHTNFTYDITPRNRLHLAHALAIVFGRTPADMTAYVDEALTDRTLSEHVISAARASPRVTVDETCHFGRRLGWYVAVRVMKPRVVVETGVDKGLGAVLLCAALRRNEAEGSGGRYFGIDIDPTAGFLLGGPYRPFGTLLHGDSIQCLALVQDPIDILITDSDHAAGYEYREYLAARERLAERALILADNAHASDALARFSIETGRKFLFLREEPLDHWYPGAGIGISYCA